MGISRNTKSFVTYLGMDRCKSIGFKGRRIGNIEGDLGPTSWQFLPLETLSYLETTANSDSEVIRDFLKAIPQRPGKNSNVSNLSVHLFETSLTSPLNIHAESS